MMCLTALVVLGTVTSSLQLPTPDRAGLNQDRADFLDSFQQWLQQNKAGSERFDGVWTPDSSWPQNPVALGEIGGVATDKQGDVVVFHRGDKHWTKETFDMDNVYTGPRDQPIAENTVLTLDSMDGKPSGGWGKHRFYLPHGLEIDSEGNYWVTDVALHQVLKFGTNKTEPLLTLGKAFEPATGNHDTTRFCKPTDVAVATNGDFFVADGYCNSRVLKFRSDGSLVGVLAEGDLWVPHSLALVEDLDLICVADRENNRVLCYRAGLEDESVLGAPDRAYLDSQLLGRVYAIDYSPKNGYLYAVTAPTDGLPGAGFTIDLYEEDNTKDMVSMWGPPEQEFQVPHDLAVTADGRQLYVAELAGGPVWKFTQGSDAPAGSDTATDDQASGAVTGSKPAHSETGPEAGHTKTGNNPAPERP